MANRRHRASRCPDVLKPVRHYRGHGIHSPFAYELVRNVFMRKDLLRNHGNEIFENLRRRGVKKRTAILVQNLYDYIGFGAFEIDGGRSEENVDNSGTLLIFTPVASEGNILPLVDAQEEGGGNAVCIISPRRGRLRRYVSAYLVDGHGGMSIESRRVLLLFYGKGLNKQHIKL